MSIQEPSLLERAIARTIAFFDTLDYPLTDSEIAKFLFLPSSEQSFYLRDIRAAISSSGFLQRVIAVCDGLYALVGRAGLSTQRRHCAVHAYRKYRRAKRVIALLSHVPFVRMICVCNTLGLNVARDESDIDLFVVAARSHLWLSRLICTGIAHILGLRPRREQERDTICLSFYVSEEALDLSSLQLPGWTPDLYLAYWITWCVPMYDANTYSRFFEANAWIKEFLPNVIPYEPIPRRRVVLSPVSQFVKNACETLLSWRVIEHVARWIQYRLFPPAIRNHMNRGGGVVVTDSILKFHTADRRGEIKKIFLERCRQLKI